MAETEMFDVNCHTAPPESTTRCAGNKRRPSYMRGPAFSYAQVNLGLSIVTTQRVPSPFNNEERKGPMTRVPACVRVVKRTTRGARPSDCNAVTFLASHQQNWRQQTTRAGRKLENVSLAFVH